MYSSPSRSFDDVKIDVNLTLTSSLRKRSDTWYRLSGTYFKGAFLFFFYEGFGC